MVKQIGVESFETSYRGRLGGSLFIDSVDQFELLKRYR